MIRLHIVGRLIPIIADDAVVRPDPISDDDKAGFSTGFLKVTPAHDPTDWEIGERHNLEVINVFGPDGTISHNYRWKDWEEINNPDVESLLGLDRFDARKKIFDWLRSHELLERMVDYEREVGQLNTAVSSRLLKPFYNQHYQYEISLQS